MPTQMIISGPSAILGRLLRTTRNGSRILRAVSLNHSSIDINVPGGVDNGQVLTLRGQGEGGKNGGIAGDMHVVISVTPHKLLKREGADVYIDVPISFTDSLLGTKTEIAASPYPIIRKKTFPQKL